ncbi:hypothetical protein [Rhizobium sp. Root708]|uniref:hypothetical protein n=1 Tax=Rhizobium sp. Root708 TaxID=1736592 RepID=UPI001FCDAC61|nr:hypothetical protein [Rhizobium sp. Root708]
MFILPGGKMTALMTDIASAAVQLEAAIREVTFIEADAPEASKPMNFKAKYLPRLLVERYPELSSIERELRGVFEVCSAAIDRKNVNPVVAKAAISLAREYRGVIDGLKHNS